MLRLPNAPVLLLLSSTACLLAACESPDLVCDFRDDDLSDDVRRATGTRSGTLTLPPGEVRERRRFRVRVEGLSELGTTRPRWGASFVSVARSLSYRALPEGTELPSVEVTLGVVGSGHVIEVDRFGFDRLPLFACANSSGPDCCPPGEPVCEVEVELTFGRDDLLFPAVDVDWQADFQVGFSGCTGEDIVTLDVEALAP